MTIKKERAEITYIYIYMYNEQSGFHSNVLNSTCTNGSCSSGGHTYKGFDLGKEAIFASYWQSFYFAQVGQLLDNNNTDTFQESGYALPGPMLKPYFP